MDTPRPEVDSQILDEISGLMEHGRPDELTLRRLDRRAEQLMRTDRPDLGWVARAAVAAFAWDVGAVEDISRRARQAFGRNAVQIANLSVSHKHVNLMDQAVEYAREATEIAPGDATIMDHLLQGLALSGRWSEALAISREFIQRVGPTHAGPVATEIEAAFPMRLDWLAQAGVSEEQLQFELREAWAAMREAQVRSAGEQSWFEEDWEGGSGTFCVRIQFPGDIDLEMRLGSLLGPRLAQLPHWDPTRLSVDFAYHREDADATA
ncbi:hypothetical protein [Ramlibacter sp.]|uniref:tetratricopeptide repeat protein n=1 Tax=Ramlibacter sp. TaxID=1917967 RepID=UPI00260EDC73|nr:hypothetical protein [Ramlibacter sp.]MDB5953838.1 hypothetical protein [Ramlibacter sp.]